TKSILNNKLYFSLFCQSNSMATCELLAYNLYNSFFYKSQCRTIHNATEFYNFCCLLFKDGKNKRIFIKRSESMGGKGIFLLTPSSTKEEYNKLWPIIEKNAFIFEKAIEQHKSVSAIYPNSINTIRIETYYSKDGNIEILGGLMRFGSGESVIDNVSSGGLYVSINMEKGILMKYGKTDLHSGAHRYI